MKSNKTHLHESKFKNFLYTSNAPYKGDRKEEKGRKGEKVEQGDNGTDGIKGKGGKKKGESRRKDRVEQRD